MISAVSKQAERKTGIPVDVLCAGMPVTNDSMEHIAALFDYPIHCRGFPIYWRDEKYLDSVLRMKNKFFDKQKRLKSR